LTAAASSSSKFSQLLFHFHHGCHPPHRHCRGCHHHLRHQCGVLSTLSPRVSLYVIIFVECHVQVNHHGVSAVAVISTSIVTLCALFITNISLPRVLLARAQLTHYQYVHPACNCPHHQLTISMGGAPIIIIIMGVITIFRGNWWYPHHGGIMSVTNVVIIVAISFIATA